ncbi:putative protein-serine/threonine phosphatase [Helianthus anomalus]
MSEEVIRQAFLNTDEEFLVSVEREWQNNPKIASVGSCCLAGVVCNGMLYVANAGDSRAVLGKQVDKTDGSVRDDLIALVFFSHVKKNQYTKLDFNILIKYLQVHKT